MRVALDTNILAYARQPISKPPKVGDPVQVRKIGQPRLTSVGHVIQVGTQLQWGRSLDVNIECQKGLVGSSENSEGKPSRAWIFSAQARRISLQ